MEKRGQVSTFIIIGLLVLTVVGLFFFLREYIIAPYVSPELAPLVKYTESCVNTITGEAITLASNQGGYIYLPEKITKTPDSYVNLGFRVPYWYYRGENRIPTTKNIETQLTRYLNENLNSCLKNFDTFKNQFLFEGSQLAQMVNLLNTNVKLNEDSLGISVEIPLKITVLQQNITMTFPNVEVDVPNKLGKLHELAKAIMEHENNAAFLENFTDEMIAVSDYLPYEGMELTCAQRKWTTSEIRDYIKNLFMYNFKYLMFENTNYRETPYTYYNKQYKVSVTKKDFKELQVNTIYNPKWPLDVEVVPNDNGIVKPLNMDIPEVIGQCIKIYHHKYSLNYPIVFQIINTEQPSQQFYFATPVIMRRNDPNRYDEIQPWPDEVDVTASKDYCSNVTPVTLYSQDANGNIITRQGTSSNLQHTVRVFAFDDTLPEPYNSLIGVNISYQCVKFKCYIGGTNYQTNAQGLYTGGLAELQTKFPPCQRGIILAEKEGYLPLKKSITTNTETDGQQVTLKMIRIKPFNFGVKVIQNHNNILSQRDLNSDEQVFIKIKQPQEKQEQWRAYPEQKEPIELLVGKYTYTLDLKLIRNDNVYGGLMLNWTPTIEQLSNNNYLELLVYVKDPLIPPTTPQEFNRLWNYAVENSNSYPPVLKTTG